MSACCYVDQRAAAWVRPTRVGHADPAHFATQGFARHRTGCHSLDVRAPINWYAARTPIGYGLHRLPE